jgi:hypothetical protein
MIIIERSMFDDQSSTLNVPLLYYTQIFRTPEVTESRSPSRVTNHVGQAEHEPEVDTWRGPGVTHVLIRGDTCHALIGIRGL